MYTKINPVFRNSPQLVLQGFGPALAEVTLKLETLNPIRSFKARGTENLVSSLPEGAPPELVCASAGNFGQALAYSGVQRGFTVTVFAALGASPLKIARMRQLGARVILEGKDFDAAKTAARRYAMNSKALFLEDGCHEAIAEGAGTIAEELLRGPARYESVIVPVGNGSLIIGIGNYFKRFSPETKIIGVCAEGAPAMAASWARKAKVSMPASTIADGIAVREPVLEALEKTYAIVDEYLLVEDEMIVRAMAELFDTCGLVAEPAGAAGLAALLQYPGHFSGGQVATILCGSNISQQQFFELTRGRGSR